DAAQLTRIILSLDEENADLKARIAFLERQLFGAKSEKMTIIDPAQATLDLGDPGDIPVAANDDAAPAGEDKTQARRSPARNIGRLPKHLPRYEEIIGHCQVVRWAGCSYQFGMKMPCSFPRL
ncbi:transposase, partial [Brucella intermedia]|uniref:transposase n=1 Tax=Brucella intermedia TaxID=94625 RepID=UPI001FFF7494